MIWFTSDLHLGHNRDFLYEPRGFKNIQEHDETIIKNWNKVVHPSDRVYVLGDLMLNDNEAGIKKIKQLKGQIYVVRGNHDSEVRMNLYNDCYNIIKVTEGQFFRYGKYHFYLSHYPTLCSNFDSNKPLKARTVSLCGHSHCQNPFADWDKGLIYHVELDAHNNFPVSIDSIIEDIKKKIK